VEQVFGVHDILLNFLTVILGMTSIGAVLTLFCISQWPGGTSPQILPRPPNF